MHPVHYAKVLKGAVKRNLQVDLNYKFQLVTDVIDMLLIIVAFTVLGAFVDEAADPGELGIDYGLQGFLLMGVLFWALYQRAYEDTVAALPEEASRGTIGFLVTNNVSLSTLLLARNIASMVKTLLTTLFIVLPVLLMVDLAQGGMPGQRGLFAGFGLGDLPLIVGVFLLIWVFMLMVSLLVASLNIVSKRITPFANMVVTALKVLSGYYFPIEALDGYLGTGVAIWLKTHIPIITGLVFLRDMVLVPGPKPGFDVLWATYLEPMLVGILITGIVAGLLYKYLERKAQSWGTLEFY